MAGNLIPIFNVLWSSLGHNGFPRPQRWDIDDCPESFVVKGLIIVQNVTGLFDVVVGTA